MQSKKITLGFVSSFDPSDRKASSGTSYKIYENLLNVGFHIVWIPIVKSRNIFYRLYFKIIYITSKRKHKNYQIEHTSYSAYLMSKSLNKKLIADSDVFLFYFSNSALFSFNTNKPIVYLSDATFASMLGYYPEFSNLFKFNINQGLKIDKRAMQKSSTIIFSSDWAKRSAINDYGISPDKINVVEFGANIDEKDIVTKNRKVDEPLQLLFLGVWWERKGGDIAVEACKKLNEKGIKSILHIVGAREVSESIKALPYIDYIGFLDKNIPEQYNKLVETIKLCHCLLLPTKAECSAIAFAESSANGLPIFSHDTGGVSNYVFAGKNGYLLPLGSTGEDFANKIAECYKSGELQQMSETARDVYREKLNWNVWAQKVKVIIEDLVEQNSEK